jgi:glycogen synthase
MKKRQPKIVYISGPINAAEVFDRWSKNIHTSQYFGTVYLEQFFAVCSSLDARLYTVTTLPGENTTAEKNGHVFRNHPTPENSSGILYHAQSVWWFVSLFPGILRFWPNVVVSTAMQNYWFMLIIFRLFNIKLVSSLHCVIWPQFGEQKTSQKFLNTLNYPYYSLFATEFMVVSADIGKQLQAGYRVSKELINEFIPTYSKTRFGDVKRNGLSQHPFRIVFSGRIEENKGIFDLVQIARRLQLIRPGAYKIDVCGEGSESGHFQNMISSLNLDSVITYHGYCGVTQQKELFDLSHVVIVPTRTTFEEGFNKVCAEAVISLRPVITSAVCPALNYIRDAAIEVDPDDTDQYCQAIIQLSSDAVLYEEKVDACVAAREQFFDESKSYGAKLAKVLGKHCGSKPNDELKI